MMLATTCTTAAATAALQRQPAVSGVTAVPSGNPKMPVLFAVPAPSSMGKDLMCLCRKIYWTNGALMYCAYSPVTKEEAAIFLRDPSIINVLSKPVTGTNLLTVSPNGSIIGVQQTVGYLAPNAPPSGGEKKLPVPRKHTRSVASPQEAEKVPLKSPDLPKSTTTPTKAQKPAESKPLFVTTSERTLPKINAVFTLAETGVPSVDFSQQAVVSSNTSREYAMEGPIRESKELTKESVKQTDQLNMPHQDSNATKPTVTKCNRDKIIQPSGAPTSNEVQCDGRPGSVTELQEFVNTVTTAPPLHPPIEIMHKIPNQEPVSKAKESTDRSALPPQKPPHIDTSLEDVSTALNADSISDIPKERLNEANRVEPVPTEMPLITIPKNVHGSGSVATLSNSEQTKDLLLSAKINDQAKDLTSKSDLTSQSAKDFPLKTEDIPLKTFHGDKPSNVLSDVQNKCYNPDPNDSQTRGIKRKVSSSNESVDKKTKMSKVTESEGLPLKVKFSWTKRWTVEGKETYFKYEPTKKPVILPTHDPDITFRFDSSEQLNEHKQQVALLTTKSDGSVDKRKDTSTAEQSEDLPALVKTNAGRRRTKKSRTTPVEVTPTKVVKRKTGQKRSPRVVYTYPTVQVKLPNETIVINTATGFQFTCEDAGDKLVCINHKLPQLKPIKKLGREEAIRLGCNPYCSLLPPTNEKKVQKQDKKTKATFAPGKAPSVDTLTKNPDFHHIPTGDKVAYLKEILKMQRAALGLSL